MRLNWATLALLSTNLSLGVTQNVGDFVYQGMNNQYSDYEDANEGPDEALSACQKVAREQYSQSGSGLPLGGIPLDARLVHECARSVKLIPEDAFQYLQYVKEYQQYHTGLPYVKEPPESYQQPAVDVMTRIDYLMDKVSNGDIENQYDFDVEIALLGKSVNEFHFTLKSGIIGNDLFDWGLPHTLTSISEDGKKLPKVYVFDDIWQADTQFSLDWEPSPIETINDKSTLAYLIEIATTSTTDQCNEAHTEWNVMMTNPAYSLGGLFDQSAFAVTKIYRGDSIKGTFENGSDFTWKFQGYSQFNLTGQGLSTSEDIYNNLVLASSSQSRINSIKPRAASEDNRFFAKTKGKGGQSEEPMYYPYHVHEHMELYEPSTQPPANYPIPDFVQINYGDYGGKTSGYLLKEDSICAVSIAGFTFGEEDPITAISDVIFDTIVACSEAGLEKIVVDLSGNGGGTVVAGFDAFKHFFPDEYPHQLLRAMAVPAANVVGKIFTSILQDEIGEGNNLTELALELVASPGLQAATSTDSDGKRFDSWTSFFGSVSADGGKFTNPALRDFDGPILLSYHSVFGFGERLVPDDYPRWNKSNIVVLTDGFCGSTCAVFSELMKSVGGVKFVAIGGTPVYGPMQAVGASRGSNVLDWELIDSIAGEIRIAAESKEQAELYNITSDDLDLLPSAIADMRYRANGRYNKLDIIRDGDDIPIEFAYEPADCRLFYTADMIVDQSLVWKAAARIADGDYDACVKGSTRQKGSRGKTLFDSPGFRSSFHDAVDGIWPGNDTWGQDNLLE